MLSLLTSPNTIISYSEAKMSVTLLFDLRNVNDSAATLSLGSHQRALFFSFNSRLQTKTKPPAFSFNSSDCCGHLLSPPRSINNPEEKSRLRKSLLLWFLSELRFLFYCHGRDPATLWRVFFFFTFAMIKYNKIYACCMSNRFNSAFPAWMTLETELLS